MTREQKRLKVMQGDGKVFETLDVSITTTYLSSEYTCLNPVQNEIGETGRLNVFELPPATVGLPRFLARWDEKANQIDIDVDGVTHMVKDEFKHAMNGYKGHWSKPAPTSTKMYTYDIGIEIPSQKVFEGTISFTARRRQDMPGVSCIAPSEQ